MPRIPWIFYDPILDETYAFPINPKDDGSLQYEKSIVYKNTSGQYGDTVAFEGRDNPYTASFSGTILTEEQYDAMVTWFNKRYAISVEDDLGRQFTIYITKFSPKRQLSRSYPWRHEYSVDYFIVSRD